MWEEFCKLKCPNCYETFSGQIWAVHFFPLLPNPVHSLSQNLPPTHGVLTKKCVLIYQRLRDVRHAMENNVTQSTMKNYTTIKELNLIVLWSSPYHHCSRILNSLIMTNNMCIRWLFKNSFGCSVLVHTRLRHLNCWRESGKPNRENWKPHQIPRKTACVLAPKPKPKCSKKEKLQTSTDAKTEKRK